jgi:hypothetical protein
VGLPGRVLIRRNDFQKAKQLLEKALAIDPSIRITPLDLGIVFAEAKIRGCYRCLQGCDPAGQFQNRRHRLAGEVPVPLPQRANAGREVDH